MEGEILQPTSLEFPVMMMSSPAAWQLEQYTRGLCWVLGYYYQVHARTCIVLYIVYYGRNSVLVASYTIIFSGPTYALELDVHLQYS